MSDESTAPSDGYTCVTGGQMRFAGLVHSCPTGLPVSFSQRRNEMSAHGCISTRCSCGVYRCSICYPHCGACGKTADSEDTYFTRSFPARNEMSDKPTKYHCETCELQAARDALKADLAASR